MELGYFETVGGDDPKFSVRIYQPNILKADITKNGQYKNAIVEELSKRHRLNIEVIKHFFIHNFDNETRWNYIEDFFLGMSNEKLFEKYCGETPNKQDIVNYIESYIESKK